MVGFDWVNVNQLFEALYATKPSGLGMGVLITRSIVLEHGGRLWATPNAI
jgi:signal transduction histidine kinase